MTVPDLSPVFHFPIHAKKWSRRHAAEPSKDVCGWRWRKRPRRSEYGALRATGYDRTFVDEAKGSRRKAAPFRGAALLACGSPTFAFGLAQNT